MSAASNMTGAAPAAEAGRRPLSILNPPREKSLMPVAWSITVALYAVAIGAAVIWAALFPAKTLAELFALGVEEQVAPPPPTVDVELVAVEEDPPPPPPPAETIEFEKPAPPPKVEEKPVEKPPVPAPPQPAPAARPLQAASREFKPGLAWCPKPPYPYQARLRRYQGVVKLSVSVSPSGAVSDVAIASSSGYVVLDAAAQSYVKTKWGPFPPQFRGATHILPISFELGAP